MKKLALTISIVLGMAIGVTAQEGQWWGNSGGLFQKGETTESSIVTAFHGYDNYSDRYGGLVSLPNQFGNGGDFNGTNGEAPLGSGIAVLFGLGAAYAANKRRKMKE